MGKVKQIEINNRTFTTTWSISKMFKSNFLNIDKKHYKWIDIYYTGYITSKKIGVCENIHSVNPFHLLIDQESRDIKEKMERNNWFLMILLMKTNGY